MTKQKYRKILTAFLFFSIITGCIYYIHFIKINIPDNIYIAPYENEEIDFNIPFLGTFTVEDEHKDSIAAASVNLMNSVSIDTSGNTSYKMDIRLFGFIKLKEVNVVVKEPESVYVGGIPIGIHLETKGILIVDTGNIKTEAREKESPSKGILTSGDYILEINNIKITDKAQMADIIQNSDDDIVNMLINRNGEEVNVKISPVKDVENLRKIGVWVRDDCQGLGTLTYVDDNNRFGALGHAICEENTGCNVSIENGYLYTARIWSIIKGQKGKPGEVVGSINYGEKNNLGIIKKNTSKGIYGTVNQSIFAYLDNNKVYTSYKQNIKTGPAYIRSFVNGEIKDYKIIINNISFNEKEKNKGIIFEIIDENLIETTNGIIQGMSGSPILQDGRIIGAVTHVFVNDPEKGYGIFIENMLDEN